MAHYLFENTKAKSLCLTYNRHRPLKKPEKLISVPPFIKHPRVAIICMTYVSNKQTYVLANRIEVLAVKLVKTLKVVTSTSWPESKKCIVE